MDENKLKKLREIEYRVPGCCGLCVSFRGNWSTGWGTCTQHRYQHKKHAGDKRQMSVCIYGRCDEFFEGDKMDLGSFVEFLEVLGA